MAGIAFTLNGRAVSVATEGTRMLAHVLRGDLGLTGTKLGCGVGLCGACAVLVDGQEVRSCSTPVAEVAGRTVVTIEGLDAQGALHPVQAAFLEHQAFQCGFCTPGMIIGACALLGAQRRPTRAEAAAALEGHLCRCGTHGRILDAVQAAAEKGGAR